MHVVRDGLISILYNSGQLLEFGVNHIWLTEQFEELLAELKIFVLDVGLISSNCLGAIFCNMMPTIRFTGICEVIKYLLI